MALLACSFWSKFVEDNRREVHDNQGKWQENIACLTEKPFKINYICHLCSVVLTKLHFDGYST